MVALCPRFLLNAGEWASGGFQGGCFPLPGVAVNQIASEPRYLLAGRLQLRDFCMEVFCFLGEFF
jgi:hypothetical protein